MNRPQSARFFYELLRLDHGRIHAAWKVAGWLCGRHLYLSRRRWRWGRRRIAR